MLLSDMLLLAGFGGSLALNGALLLQVVYFSTVKEGKALAQVFTSDFQNASADKDKEKKT